MKGGLQLNRRLIMLLVVLATAFSAAAQPYNNEWIDFSKTYYKFKVGADGLYRIPAATLQANGLNNIPAEQFRLFRNGKEVPLFTSVPTGLMPADGYIEFWGLANDGETDRVLYREEQFQHRTKYNLHADTAMYFLTVAPGVQNKRFVAMNNDVASNTLPAEPYFMYKLARDFKERLNSGFAADLEQYVFSSSYDKGEFFSSSEIRQRITRTDNQTNLRAAPGGPDARLSFGAFGNTTKTRRLRVELNSTQLYENSMNFFSDLLASVTVPASLLAGGSASLAFTNVQPPAPPTGPDPYLDRMVLSFYELTYAREFNFNNQRTFPFELEARTNGYFLEIRNFNAGGIAPVLYDLENQERYVANTQVNGVLRFALPGSAVARKMVLVSQAAATGYPITISTLSSKTFTDFSNPGLQGNYLIISHQQLMNTSGGSNPLEDYRQYRSSATGGGFTAKIYDIAELTDQFAFGQYGHPLSVKNFIRFARANFSSPLQHIFIVGKGVTYNYYRSSTTALRPQLTELNLVPTFGFPGSDNLLSAASSSDPIIQTPIGRLSVIKPVEIADYLEKVKEYEQEQRTISGKIEDKLWMKNVLHVTGATDALLGVQLCNYMSSYKTMIDDTLTGASAIVLCKTASGQQDESGSLIIRRKFEEGISLLTYFGHSSANTLEFSIEDPEDYNNKGKYPVFSVNGCYAGDFFQYSIGRFQVFETLTEKFTLAKQKGSIAFIASTHFGVVNYLAAYLNSFYGQIGKTDYGQTVGVVVKDALAAMKQRYSPIDFLARVHAEQVSLHGDPALVMNFQEKPDYAVEESTIEISPSFISVSDQSFTAKVKYYNIGKAINDSVHVEVKRVNPDGSEQLLYNQKRLAPKMVDSLEFNLPIVATIHKGQGRIVVSLDGLDAIAEMTEENNTASKTFFIYEDEASPAYPYNYSIVSDPAQKFYASTANPFSSMKQYIMELDTTTNFNSTLKKSVTISSEGGLLEFNPQTTFLDSVVYYWRTALVPGEGGEYIWNLSSFQFRNNGQSGFNQSHYYQHKESDLFQLNLSEGNKWSFGTKVNTIQVRHAMYPTSGTEDSDFSILINDADYIRSACLGRSLIFTVIDPRTMVPWKNVDENGQNLNRFGSASANCAPSRNWNFEFSYMTAASRKLMMDMMDSIPDGYYVIVRSFDYSNPASFSATWRADTTLYGSNKSLYHKLLAAGFSNIDELNAPKTWGLLYKKNDPSFAPQTRVSAGLYDRFFISSNTPSPDSTGTIKSPSFGPAKAWKELRWNGAFVEAGTPDQVTIQLMGVNATGGSPVVLKEINLEDKIVDISDIDAARYPYLQLLMQNKDAVNFTPFQLSYWKLIYDPVPEGAIVPKLYLSVKDTVEIGEPVQFGIAFKNITNIAFDSLKVKVSISDANNITTELPVVKQKPLPGQDTLRFNYTIDTKKYPGLNTLYVDFNPDFDQPEQYRFNNFLFRNLYVKGDATHPLLDVTFDGVHILNGDIVSAKPRIQIKLKDESKYMLLEDTSLMRIQVKFPDGTIKTYRFDSDTVRFTPAVAGTDNTATIEFTPAFLQTFDQETGMDSYELTVVGKDASNNSAGRAGYSIEFKVVNKPMISNLLNYPNPFSTSTAFVFTLTGSEVPTNFKIQILTVTGKVVREITGEELGPLRIGRNITEYKWDGTDQFGQRLANGVYLYRVVSTLNGMKMDKFKTDGDNTDKYFTRGYGKMYLIR
ncbi:C25 family cysteine peptidase [Flavihumibacter sp. CACIAM 22H1]|uniref:putative type IX secretion system sortase PorU2 n=1 Tax=Flavihumibacter sp. CACIAM 22H1 TaxID=1812911 RepID=UPI0025C5B847|nr:C25 family cysteine peptidase [Flavihumibacter sp. CACIAM 22H1]